MILDGIICSTLQQFCNFSPSVTISHVRLDDCFVFFEVERGLVNRGVQVVHPSLATLLSIPTGKLLRNLGPLLLTVHIRHEVDQLSVLLTFVFFRVNRQEMNKEQTKDSYSQLNIPYYAFTYFFCPGCLHNVWVEDFAPAMQTLYFTSARQMSCYFFPVFVFKNDHHFAQNVVLY